MLVLTKRISAITAVLIFLLGSLVISGQEGETSDTNSAVEIIKHDSIRTDTASADSNNSVPEKIIVYYLHGTRRCATCKKLQAYSFEAIRQAFDQKLKAGVMELRSVDYDQKENKHFVKEYRLYTKALILSRVINDKEIEWKNLDKIWEFVGDKERFFDYVQNETRAFINRDSD